MQKGFAPILVVVGIAILAITSGIFYTVVLRDTENEIPKDEMREIIDDSETTEKNNSDEKTNNPSPTGKSTNTPTKTPIPTTTTNWIPGKKYSG